MQFNSYIFIAFISVIILLYFLLGKIDILIGKVVIIIGSLVFYAYSGIMTLKILGISVIINSLFVKLINKTKWQKIFMAIPILVNICLLLYFKYTNFAITNINAWFNKELSLREIALPVGISFFTFQQIAYIVAVYKGEIENESIVDYLAYILYFPKILMGPLMDPVDFVKQFNNPDLKKVNWDNVACGIKIFCFGLLKKMLLADTFAKAVLWGYSNIETTTSMDWFLVMQFYTFEIYFDFSGYSDMAVGASQMLNITLPINFDSPYKAISIRDFWKRWHISLTKFLTKYIYIPLGGSKKGMIFTCLNTMIVFLISGIWHGANWTFIFWGGIHGVFSVLDRLIDKSSKKIFEPARWINTFFVVSILWLLFRSDSVAQWWSILKNMISLSNMAISKDLMNIFVIPESSFIFDTFHIISILNGYINGFMMIIFILVSFVICFLPENNYRNLKKITVVNMILAAIAFIWGITCLGSESVFVYFNF